MSTKKPSKKKPQKDEPDAPRLLEGKRRECDPELEERLADAGMRAREAKRAGREP